MASQITNEQFTGKIDTLLREIFEKVDGIILDGGTSLFETIDGLAAEQASRTVTESGTTIAGHVYHIRFYLQVLHEYMEGGRRQNLDWKQSWIVKTTSVTEWNELRKQTKDEYAVLIEYLKGIADWTDDRLGGALAILGHTAYHLGAIRQIMRAAK